MGRAQRPAQPVMGRQRQPLGLRLRQHGVGGDERDRRVLAGAALEAQGQVVQADRRGPAAAAELALLLVGRRPEMRAVADGGAADRVDRDQRADHLTGRGPCAGGAEPALEVDRGGAEAGAGRAERELRRGGGRSLRAEPAIGRFTGSGRPALIAAIGEIEQDRLRDDGYAVAGDREAAALAGEPAHRPVRRAQAPGGAAGEDDAVDMLYRHLRFEQGGVAGAGPAAEHGGRGGGRPVEQDGGDARGRAVSWALPTRMPRMSVMRLRMSGIRGRTESCRARWGSHYDLFIRGPFGGHGRQAIVLTSPIGFDTRRANSDRPHRRCP